MNDVTIIVNTCDRNQAIWEIFAYSYRKYWPDCPWEIVVMTNNLTAPIGQSTKSGNNSNWTSMMKDALTKIATPYVMLVLDDYFLTERVDTAKLLEFVRIMKRDNITHIRTTPATDGIEDYPNDTRFKLITKNSIYRTSLSTAIWNKEHLISFLSDGENIWQFETQGRYREQGKYLILSVKEYSFPTLDRDNPDPKWNGLLSIEQGVWQDGAKKYVKEEGLECDFSVNTKRQIKILWLYQYMKNTNYDHWFHIDFAKAISEYPNVALKCYGLGMHEGYPQISLEYNKNKLLSDIKKEFDFDIIISNTKSRMFERYISPAHGREERYNCWLPKDFATWNKTPKISLEEDYHYEVNDSWYVENNVDLLLQRHYSQALRNETIKKIWFPFSVNTSVFTPSNQQRVKKLCNIGGASLSIYPHRYNLIKMLTPLVLLENPTNMRVGAFDKNSNAYLECLQKYIAYLSCSSIYNITPAKMFEVMASGGILFTNNSNKYGLNDLFPKDSYFTYEEDYSDVRSKLNLIINNPKLVNETTNKALTCIKEKHSDNIRIKELLEIIKNEFNI